MKSHNLSHVVRLPICSALSVRGIGVCDRYVTGTAHVLLLNCPRNPLEPFAAVSP